MRAGGLEPPHPAAPEPKSGVSTNFTTLANAVEIYMMYDRNTNCFLRDENYLPKRAQALVKSSSGVSAISASDASVDNLL